MSLSTFFSLSGKNPTSNTYDAANPNAPYAAATIYLCGGIVFPYQSQTLNHQYNWDAPVMGYDASLPGSPLFSENNNPWRSSSLILSFGGYNVTDQNQYLLRFQFRGLQGSPSVEFFVGSSWVSTEPLGLHIDQEHSILLDCPSDNYWFIIYVRLVSLDYSSMVSFQGLDCFLL